MLLRVLLASQATYGRLLQVMSDVVPLEHLRQLLLIVVLIRYVVYAIVMLYRYLLNLLI